MIRYMWPSFLKRPIDITSFILIYVHNFHQIFHLKTYISTFYKKYMISTGILIFNVWLLEVFPIDLFQPIELYVEKSDSNLWKELNWRRHKCCIEVDTNPKTIVWKASPQRNSKHARLHQLIFNYSWRCRLAKYCFQKKNQCIQSPGFPIPNCPFKQGRKFSRAM